MTTDAHGRIFVIGGLAGDDTTVYSRVDVYTPSTGKWARAAGLPEARFQVLSTFTPDGRVWINGGYDRWGNPFGYGLVFTPA